MRTKAPAPATPTPTTSGRGRSSRYVRKSLSSSSVFRAGEVVGVGKIGTRLGPSSPDPLPLSPAEI